MRAADFIVEESDYTSPSEINLINQLETLRNRFGDVHEEPKIRLQALVNLVRTTPGSEMFNVDSLITAYDKNKSVKNLITSIRDDDSGNKYVYIRPAIGEVDTDIEIEPTANGSGKSIGRQNPQKTISTMSKRALRRRK
jgi:hypothetical protein